MKLIFNIARRFYPRPLMVFTEPIPGDEPIIFVANHEKNYGPSVMQLFFPIHYRPWIIYHMLDRAECKQYIQETFFEERYHLSPWVSDGLARLFSPVLVWLMKKTNPVPVYRGNPRRIVETFRQSMDALEYGDNLLIFPENQQAGIFSGDVFQFFDGFLYVAKLYQRKFGKGLMFYPVAINPESETVTVGKGTRFDISQGYTSEAERIRTHLMQQISSLYQQPWPLKVKEGSFQNPELSLTSL